MLLENENKKLNELLDKYIKNSNNTQNNNTINITLTNFGNENYNKLTNDEQLKILKSNKHLHVNDRLPQYKNICIKNLRGK